MPSNAEAEAVYAAPLEQDAPTVVFLHEGLGSVALWKAFPQRLRDRTGCGLLVYTRGPARDTRYMHDEALRTLPEVLNAYGIERPVLFGHSDGASIAIIYAGTHPARVRGLILEAPHVFVEDVSVESIAAARTAYAQAGLRARLARYHGDVDAVFRGWNDVWLSPEFRDWNIERYAESIGAPLLLIQGEADEYGTFAQLESIRARATKAPFVQELRIAGVGHTPHRDEPETVLAAAAGFLMQV